MIINSKFSLRFSLFSFIFFVFLIPSIAQSNFSLNLASDDCGPKVLNYIENNNIGYTHVIYGKDIYPNNPYEVNTMTLTKAIIMAFPSKNSAGLGVLDWEGAAFNSLAYKSSSNPDFKKALNAFTKALNIAISLRPNVKWGYYGIPFRRAMYKSDNSWATSIDNVKSLLNQCTAFFPNFYRVSNMNTENLQAGMLRSRQSSVGKYAEMALKVGVKYNKPVYGFVWHRFMGQDPKYRFHKLTEDDFMNTINDIKNARYNGERIAGIVWWSMDAHFYKVHDKVISKEAVNFSTFKSNYDNMLINYLKKIKNGL